MKIVDTVIRKIKVKYQEVFKVKLSQLTKFLYETKRKVAFTSTFKVDGCPSKEYSIWAVRVINKCYVYCFSLRLSVKFME